MHTDMHTDMHTGIHAVPTQANSERESNASLGTGSAWNEDYDCHSTSSRSDLTLIPLRRYK